MAESAEILKLGLLFGEDLDVMTTDPPEVLSFQHKLIQEYLAAVYITEHVQTDSSAAFLASAIPTWETVWNNREVMHFACGLLSTTDASPLTNHIAKVLSENIQKQVNEGLDVSSPLRRALEPLISSDIALLTDFQRGSGTPIVTPHLTWYPTCGRPLAEVLANTKLAYITGIDDNDPLQLVASPAQIVIRLRKMSRKSFDRLWLALHQIDANVTVLDIPGIKSPNRANLWHFSRLKHLSIANADLPRLKDLASSIDSWGSEPPLRYCSIIPKRNAVHEPLVTILSKCPHLLYLDLSHMRLHNKLPILMTSPPPMLRQLELYSCALQGSDIDHITQAIRTDRLTKLEKMTLGWNPIGEPALQSLLKAILTKPHAMKKLNLELTGVDDSGQFYPFPGVGEEGNCYPLSTRFMDKWTDKLMDIEIYVEWDG